MPSVGVFRFACDSHETEEDVQLSSMLRTAYHLGKDQGVASLKYARDEIRREISVEFNARECRHMRTHDSHGRQLVVVGRFTYHWDGPVVAVGDTVTLPASEWYAKSQGVVDAVVSDYTGTTRGLVAVNG